MYLAESAHIKEQLKETEEKYQISQNELQQTQTQFDQTKAEYERLEKELEELDTKIQEARTQASENALKKQQLENSVELLKEQIRAAQQNHQHYEERIQTIRQELDRRQQEAAGHEQEQEALKESLGEAAVRKKEAEEKLAILHQNIEETNQSIEDGKSEIIEILNQRASTKGKMQRYDAMLEQIGIRKAALSQRVLKLKSDESQQQEIIQEHQEKCKEIGARWMVYRWNTGKWSGKSALCEARWRNRIRNWNRDRQPITGRHPVWSPCEILQNVMKDMATVSGVLWNRRIASRGSTVLLQT